MRRLWWRGCREAAPALLRREAGGTIALTRYRMLRARSTLESPRRREFNGYDGYDGRSV